MFLSKKTESENNLRLRGFRPRETREIAKCIGIYGIILDNYGFIGYSTGKGSRLN
jgi:hypothetical protein